ncbi:MAG: hypothetical protein AAFO89_11470 [Planctomycetota bacterium]
MSYNVHKRQALDTSRPIEHRMSHARSLTVITSQRHEVHRDVVLDRVHELTGLSLREPLSDEDLRTAIRCLDTLRENFPEVTIPSDVDQPDRRME